MAAIKSKENTPKGPKIRVEIGSLSQQKTCNL